MKPAIRQKLTGLGMKLRKASRRTLLGSVDWKMDVPSLGGVYAIWSKSSGEPVYVGETCHLSHRFSDLTRTVNHTFRRKMARQYRMVRSTDAMLSKRLSKDFKISFLVIDFGRKELEEFLILNWSKTLINKPQKRLLLSHEYNDL